MPRRRAQVDPVPAESEEEVRESAVDLGEFAKHFLDQKNEKWRRINVEEEVARLQSLPEQNDEAARAIAIVQGFLTDPATAFQYVPQTTDKRFLKSVARRHPDTVLRMDHPDDAVLLIALKEKIELLSSLGEVSEEVLIKLVANDPFALSHMENPSEEVQIAAVEELERNDYDFSLFYIDNYRDLVARCSSEKALKLLLNKYPLLLGFLDHPSDELIEIVIAALSKVRPILNPGFNSIFLDMFAKVKSDEHKAVLMRAYPGLIAVFEKPAESMVEACFWGVKEGIESRHFPKAFAEVCEALLKHLPQNKLVDLGDIYPPALAKIEDLTEDVLLRLVDKTPQLIEKSENPSLKLQKKAVLAAERLKMNDILKYIKNPHPEVLSAVVARCPEQLRFVNSPAEALQFLAVRMIVGMPAEGRRFELVKMEARLHVRLAERLAVALKGVALTKSVQEELLSWDYRFIAVIENVSKDLQTRIFLSNDTQGDLEDLMKKVKDIDPEVQVKLVNRNPKWVLLLNSPHIDAMKAALTAMPALIERMVNPDPEIVRFAVSKDPTLFSILAGKFPNIKDLREVADEAAWTSFSSRPPYPDHSPGSSGYRGGRGSGL